MKSAQQIYPIILYCLIYSTLAHKPQGWDEGHGGQPVTWVSTAFSLSENIARLFRDATVGSDGFGNHNRRAYSGVFGFEDAGKSAHESLSVL